MNGKKYNWHKIDQDELPLKEKEIRKVNTERETVCIALLNGQYYAFAHKCPHAGSFLTDAFIDEKATIICPLHQYKFKLKNGFNCSGEGYYLLTYPIEQRADGIYIGFAESSFRDNFPLKKFV